jgi:hypothetical protein
MLPLLEMVVQSLIGLFSDWWSVVIVAAIGLYLIWALRRRSP